MANAEEVLPPKKGPSFVMQMVMLLLMTVAAAGGGWVSGGYLKGGQETKAPVVPPPTNEHDKKEASGEGKKEGEDPNSGPLLVTLAPMTTNLASPPDTWVRLEASVVYDEPQPPAMAEDIHQDILAYLRTLKMHQIEGASGYQHLRDDLQERATIRSGGHAKEVLVRTLLVE